jgi:hypothetical protein
MKVKDSYGEIKTCSCIAKSDSDPERYKHYEECPILPKECPLLECGLNEQIPFKYRKGLKEFVIRVKRLNGDHNWKGISLPCIALDEGKTPEEAYKAACKYLDSSAQASWILFQIYNLSSKGEQFKEWFNTRHNADPKADGLVSMCQLPLTYWKKQEL